MSTILAARSAVALLCIAPLTALAADKLPSRAGAWETTTTTTMAGMLIPAEQLAKIPAEQRARMMAAMGASAGKERTHTYKSCLTEKDRDESTLFTQNEDRHCIRKLVSRTATSVVMEMSCPPPASMTGRVTMQFSSATEATGTVDMARPDGFKIHTTLKSHWLGASCAGIKD